MAIWNLFQLPSCPVPVLFGNTSASGVFASLPGKDRSRSIAAPDKGSSWLLAAPRVAFTFGLCQTKALWVYDYRTNVHETLKTKRLTNADFDDFVRCYHERKETERFRRFSYEELAQRDKLNLDIFWLKDDSLEDIDSLPEPDILAAEIVENLEAALDQFRAVSYELAPHSD